MKNGKSIKVDREIATALWKRLENYKDTFIEIHDKNTKETVLVVAVNEISHIY